MACARDDPAQEQSYGSPSWKQLPLHLSLEEPGEETFRMWVGAGYAKRLELQLDARGVPATRELPLGPSLSAGTCPRSRPPDSRLNAHAPRPVLVHNCDAADRAPVAGGAHQSSQCYPVRRSAHT